MTGQTNKSVSPRQGKPGIAKPAQHAEQTLLGAFLDHTYKAGSPLPAERELAKQLGVTRPTLREALRRLERDGWISVAHGKSSLVNDFWRDGGLNILGALLRSGRDLPENFIPNLLEARLAIAPAYTRSAVERAPEEVVELLAKADSLGDDAEAFAAFDWAVHKGLTIASRNPIYTLILNGFEGVYEPVARLYFTQEEARAASRRFYEALGRAAERKNPGGAERVAARAMSESIAFFHRLASGGA